MKAKLLVSTAFLAASVSLSAQKSATITVHADQGKEIIPKEIYGQFAEHLGSCIYGGLWVGENSDIPNIKGYRTDVFNALKDLSVPVLRWPGGCFADEYHWMDGIGPKENRPKMVNNNWGGTIEDNSFGTHEFLNLCEMLGCEPYISGNVGSGTVEELAKWVEYMTSDGDSPMANLRRKNGRDKAWKVKYLGVGNESWGCGGSMRPEYYADLYRRYSPYCRNYDGNHLFKIASGASDYDYNWTDVLMNRVGHRMQGLSLHYYTVTGWSGSKGAATQFNKDDYYWTMGKCLEMEDVIKKHCAIMDKYDKYTDRLKMANIAQIVNVLQSMILTKDKDMVLTPTYYVFKMYKVHQDATYLPLDLTCEKMNVRDNRTVPMVSATASKNKNGVIHISLSNVDADNAQEITVNLPDVNAKKAIGEILTSANLTDYNSFEKPNIVKPASFKEVKINKGIMKVKLPAKSIVTLELQ